MFKFKLLKYLITIALLVLRTTSQTQAETITESVRDIRWGTYYVERQWRTIGYGNLPNGDPAVLRTDNGTYRGWNSAPTNASVGLGQSVSSRSLDSWVDSTGRGGITEVYGNRRTTLDGNLQPYSYTFSWSWSTVPYWAPAAGAIGRAGGTSVTLARDHGSMDVTTSYAPVIKGIIPTPATGSPRYTANISTPIITNAPLGRWDVTTGRYGSYITLNSPPHVTSTNARDGTLFLLSAANTVPGSLGWAEVGRWQPQYRVTDGHGESTTFRLDIRVDTSYSLDIKMDYVNDPSGWGWTTYYPYGSNMCGGEDGWTNQALKFSTDDGWITGTFARHLRGTGFSNVTNNTGNAVRNNHRANTPVTGGDLTAFGAAVGEPTIELTPVSTAKFFIDITNPTANVQHNGGVSFTDTSTDALSGISTQTKTRVALVTTATAPTDAQYHAYDNVPMPAPGNYRVWAWTRDKAGNENRRQVLSNIRIAGEVTLSKDTDAGATLHDADCSEHDSITVMSTCLGGCAVGAKPDLLEESEITYKLILTNTEVHNATGTFIDDLPKGFVVTAAPTRVNITGTGNISSVSSLLGDSSSAHPDQYRVTGNYTLPAGAKMEIHIRGIMPQSKSSEGETDILSNQASTTWTTGSGATAINGTSVSNYANHRVNRDPYVELYTNWGGSTHEDGCTNIGSLTTNGNCTSDCQAGDSGTVQDGDIVSYQLILYNSSNSLQYFATDTLANYVSLAGNINMEGQSYEVEYTDAGGTISIPWSGTIPATGITLTQGTPYADGTFMEGLSIGTNRIYQQANSAISIAPNAMIKLTVAAKITGDIGDVLTHQVRSGYLTTASNTANLRITDVGVSEIKSNAVTHQIEEGTTLNKWAYSNTADANNPTIHETSCINFGNILTTGTCLSCTSGTAKLQKDTVITYSLTMDNTKNLHKGSNLAGTIASGIPIPGGYVDNKHADVVIPEGFAVTPTTLRVYVTDRTGASVPITNGSGTFSSPVSVDENGTPVTREVLSISGSNVDIKDTGEGTNIFTLSNISLVDNGTRWELNLDNRAYASGTTNDYRGYSITYLFDATVIGEHDSTTPANNAWVNHWKQDNGDRIRDPENPVVTTVSPASILSNSVVHVRVTEGVETQFTKVGADNLALGLSGAEFALYKWDGPSAPNTAEVNYMVDSSVLVNTDTMPAGQWVRVKENGEDAVLTDIFISGSSPLGEINLGKLQAGTYTLIETKAPSGYSLPVGQWILTIDSDNGDTGVGDWKIDFVGKTDSIAPPAAIRDETVPNAPVYKIINAEPFLIGLSGLGGTTGMLLTGFVIMAIAGNTYLVWRHKRKEK